MRCRSRPSCRLKRSRCMHSPSVKLIFQAPLTCPRRSSSALARTDSWSRSRSRSEKSRTQCCNRVCSRARDAGRSAKRQGRPRPPPGPACPQREGPARCESELLAMRHDLGLTGGRQLDHRRGIWLEVIGAISLSAAGELFNPVPASKQVKGTPNALWRTCWNALTCQFGGRVWCSDFSCKFMGIHVCVPQA